MFSSEDNSSEKELTPPPEGAAPEAKARPKKAAKKTAAPPAGAGEEKPGAEASREVPKKEKPAKTKKAEGEAAAETEPTGKKKEKAAAGEAAPGGKKKKDKAAEAEKLPADYRPRLMTYYHEKVVPDLIKKFAYRNPMMVPKLQKIVLNVGVGEASQNPKLLESSAKELSQITGQKAAVARARVSISNFKLRKGMAIGCRVTLRRWQMYEFLDRFLNVAIPRIRDFRGLSDRSFDGRGNYTIGIREQIIFPEIDIDKIERVHGFDITMVTTAKTDEEAQALLLALGVPFRRHGGEGRETGV